MVTDRRNADALMALSLQDTGFDFGRPEPRLAWAAFQRFVVQPLPGLVTVSVGYFSEHFSDRDGDLWLGFMRRLEEPSGSGWSCGCLFRVAVPQDLWGVSEANWWWGEHGTLDEWRATADGMRVFQRCLTLSGWRWEGFSE
jgi:hypothetical protein